MKVRRHWWGSRCECVPGGYLIDSVLGLEGSLSPRLQEQTCRLAADVSFAKTAGQDSVRLRIARSGFFTGGTSAVVTTSAMAFAPHAGLLKAPTTAGYVAFLNNVIAPAMAKLNSDWVMLPGSCGVKK